jgi:predicted GTPase
MKRFLIISSIIFVLIVFYSIASIFRLSPSEKQKQQEAIWFESKYQEGIKQISEGRFEDAMTSLSRAALSNYRHARLLYYYAEAEETGEPFYIDDEVPEGYSGPLAEKILALKNKMERIKAEKAKTETVRAGRTEVERVAAEQSKDGPHIVNISTNEVNPENPAAKKLDH